MSEREARCKGGGFAMTTGMTAAFAAVALASDSARADVRWDLGGEVGAIARTFSGAPARVETARVGPVFQVQGHIAIYPMVRAGVFVAHDVVPRLDGPARQNTEAGLRLKLTPPMMRAPFRVWAFVGVGYVRAYEPSRTFLAANDEALQAPGGGGGFFDVPFGLGIGARVRAPWTVFAELGGHVGWGFDGSLYDRARWPSTFPFGGRESFAASLSVGVSFEP